MAEEDHKKFRYLNHAEFSALDIHARAEYLLKASKALAGMTEELAAHVKRRDDEQKK